MGGTLYDRCQTSIISGELTDIQGHGAAVGQCQTRQSNKNAWRTLVGVSPAANA
ncbi:MAG: hypothetical protein ACJAVR_001263 [Paracoccaceae bacterium]|jgi:hypothetical protein